MTDITVEVCCLPVVPGTGTEVVPLDLLPTDDVLPCVTVASSPSPPDGPPS